MLPGPPKLRKSPRRRRRRLPLASARRRRHRRLPQIRCRCRKRGPTSNRAVGRAGRVTSAVTAASDETSVLDLDPGIAALPAPQTRVERGRTRVVGYGCERDKAAAQKAALRKDRACFGGGGNDGRCKSGSAAQPAPISQGSAGNKADNAAAGAAWTPRACAAFARAEGDRCPARPARHDADARPPRTVRFL